jgi:hypothetical protein
MELMEDGHNSEIRDDTRRRRREGRCGAAWGPEPEGSYGSWRQSMTSIPVDLDDHLMG